MKVNVKSLHFDADSKLIDYIESKLGKLGKVTDDILSTDVTLRIENSETNDNKVAEISIRIPGSSELFARRQSKSFEESVDNASQALRRQLRKYKEKQRVQKN